MKKKDELNQKKEFLPFVILFILMIIYLTALNDYFALDGDDVTYSLLAKSIVKGKGYVDLRIPFNPPHIAYPPGFPLLLTIPTILAPDKVSVLKLIPVLCTIIGLLFFYKYLRLKFRKTFAYIIFILVCINPVIFYFSNKILTQAPFFCALAIAVYFYEKFITKNETRLFSKEFIFFTLAAVSSWYFRKEGLFVFLSILFSLILNKKFKNGLIFALIFILFVTPWILRNNYVQKNALPVVKEHILQKVSVLRMFATTDLYNEDMPNATLSEIIKRFFEYSKMYFGYFIPVETFGMKFLENSVIAIIGIPFFLITGLIVSLNIREKGNLKILFKSIRPIHLYFIFGIFLVLLTHALSTKYLHPIVPFIVLFFILGIEKIANLISKKIFSKILFYFILFIFFLFSISETQRLYSEERNYSYASSDPVFAHYIEIAKWFKKNMPKEIKILTRKGEFFYWYSGCPGYSHPNTMNAEKILKFINDLEFDYVLLTETGFDYRTRRYIDNAIANYPQFFELVWEWNVPNIQKKAILLKVEK